MVKLSVQQVNSFRLQRHHLSARASKQDLTKAVSDVCGVQAQLITAAELAIRSRVQDIVVEDVRRELWKKHSLVKTWCMRGTLHLLATRDLPLYVAALRSKLQDTERWLRETAGVPTRDIRLVTDGIAEALSSGALSREELAMSVEQVEKLSPRTRVHLRSPWGILLRPAAYQGHLAFGESVGQKAMFVDPASWVKSWKDHSMDEALKRIFRRYLVAFGPSTLNDFRRWWGGLGPESLAELKSGLVQVDVDGFKGVMSSRDAESASGLERAHGVHLLPSFDSYSMFYAPRERFVTSAKRDRIFRKAAGWIYPTVVIDGSAAGIWTTKKRARKLEIIVERFRPLEQREKRGAEEEGSDIGRFLGVPAEVKYLP